ncbi:MAG: ABC transporter permease [Halobacteriaceae archaeon]
MSFRWYVARRLGWTVVATFIVLSITFGLLTIAPNAEVTQISFTAAQQGENVTQARQAAMRRMGLDEPVLQRYVNYMVNMATFNWGYSQSHSGTKVTTLIMNAIPYTMLYSVPTTIFSIIVGISIGLYSATHQYTKFDYAATFVAFFGYAIPNFWFGIILLVIFGAWLGWVPIIFDVNADLFSVTMAKQLILPVFVLTTSQVTALMRYSRAEALEYVEAEFTKAARAKGVSEYRLLTRHILRPALVPLMTILVADLLGIFIAASYLVEIVFSIPGLGRLTLEAIESNDTPLVLATTLLPVFVAIIGNLVQDIAYTVLDPRIDYGER